MDDKARQLCAYHEAGKVVFAYLCGYACDELEIPSNSRLNSGSDSAAIQDILSGNAAALAPENRQRNIGIAQKLIAIYTAGTCAKVFFENDATIPEELEMDLSGSDQVNIDKIQTFLHKAVEGHSDDYPAQAMMGAFRKLQEPSVWKAISMLAARAVAGQQLTRFYIEDTIMVAGIRPQRQPVSTSSGGVTVREEETKRPEPAQRAAPAPQPAASAASFSFGSSASPLNAMLKDFLHNIKKDWKEGELDAAVGYLNEVYRKYGN